MLESLPIQPADTQSPIPLYFQVEQDLRRLIYEEVLPPGSVVPPEHELSKAYQVSRHTIRQALGRIESDDLIERGAGRGTIVKPRKNLTSLSVARSFTTEMEALGYTTRSEILEKATGRIDASQHALLSSYVGAPSLNLTRLRFADDEPVCLQYSTILTTQCKGLGKHNFAAASLYKVLSERYKLYIKHIQYGLSAQLANKNVAGLLKVKLGDPLLAVTTTAYLDEGAIIEYSESLYRADRYEYSIVHQLSN